MGTSRRLVLADVRAAVRRAAGRVLRVALWIAGASVVLCAGLVALIVAILRPDDADPAIVHPRAKAKRVVVSAPAQERCAVDVHVRTADGSAVPGARIDVHVWSDDQGDTHGAPLVADASGDVSGAPVACGVAMMVATAPGYAPLRRQVGVRVATTPTLVDLVLVPGRHLSGEVTEPDGSPVADADIAAGITETTSDADGRYEMWVATEQTYVTASAFGHEPDTHVVAAAGAAAPARDTGGTANGADVRLDFTLQPRHEVRVWCAGLPDDQCGDVPIQCTSPLSLLGKECGGDGSGETRCVCPDGDAAIRGGGRAVRVAADADEAWLDFRDAGRIVGRVSYRGGAPVQDDCEVVALRVPQGLEDLPRGLVAARRAACDADGRFTIEGLIEGDWELVARARVPDADTSGEAMALGRYRERTLVPRHLSAGAEVDVGTIEVTGGGVIEGIVVDGVTGQPVEHGGVVALRDGATGERTTAMGDDCDADGHFRLDGLPPGSWTVAYPLSPQERVHVDLHDGEVVTGIRIVTADATALDANGFSLTNDEGDLVVSDVEPDSPAAEAGLEPGDTVVGLRVGGFDLPRGMGERGQAITRAILGHWDGPGVSLVVDRGDGEKEVPLDW